MAQPQYQDNWLTIYEGDCRMVMDEMDPQSIHAVITSPPYFGLRDYNLPPVYWGGGSWVGQLGLEPTPEAYIEHLVEVFRSVRRVLRDDGSVWLNIGDSYAQPGKSYGNIKIKDLLMMPAMVALALRADGWYIRNDVIWNKPNAMPSSVKNRLTNSYEHIFFLTKTAKYYYDNVATKEPVGEGMQKMANRRLIKYEGQYQHDTEVRMGKVSPNRMWGDRESVLRTIEGRNKRDVWSINTKPYPGAHFATFPLALVEPPILSSTSDRGVCPDCGAPWARVTKTIASEWMASCGHGSEPVPSTVMDPFGGTGVVSVAAKRHGRRSVLIDLSGEYIQQQLIRNDRVAS